MGDDNIFRLLITNFALGCATDRCRMAMGLLGELHELIGCVYRGKELDGRIKKSDEMAEYSDWKVVHDSYRSVGMENMVSIV